MSIHLASVCLSVCLLVCMRTHLFRNLHRQGYEVLYVYTFGQQRLHAVEKLLLLNQLLYCIVSQADCLTNYTQTERGGYTGQVSK